MLTLTIGSFALAINHLLLILALALATLVGWRVAKRGGENPESVLFSLFLLGLLVGGLLHLRLALHGHAIAPVPGLMNAAAASRSSRLRECTH